MSDVVTERRLQKAWRESTRLREALKDLARHSRDMLDKICHSKLNGHKYMCYGDLLDAFEASIIKAEETLGQKHEL